MKKTFFLSILLLFNFLPVHGQIKCVIQGEVVDRPYSNRIFICRPSGKADAKLAEIPIQEGRFEYIFECEYPEGYNLVFEDEHQGFAWSPILFFAENDTIHLKLYPQDENHQNLIWGGTINQKYTDYLSLRQKTFELDNFYKQFHEVMDDDAAYTDEFASLIHLFNDTETCHDTDLIYAKMSPLIESGTHHSELGKEWQKKYDILMEELTDWELDYISQDVTIPSYHILFKRIIWDYRNNNDLADIEKYLTIYNSVFAPTYPDHPYTREIEILLQSHRHIRPGGKFIDFTAPDFEGIPVTLSTQIEGQVAMISLWASWCGPCREWSMELIPIYEQYKDKGFAVVGVARETKPEHGINAAKTDGYPWLNLLEIRDTGKIWYLYGIANSAGGTILVDKDGTILAINPKTEEVVKILEEKL